MLHPPIFCNVNLRIRSLTIAIPMAVTLSKSLTSSLFSANKKKIAKNYSSQAYYPQSIPVVQQLGSLACFATEDYTAIKHMENIMKVKHTLMQVDDPFESMLTVDYLQKLGIDYHFNEEIESMLRSLYENFSHTEGKQNTDDLFEATLSFRLLRQAGYPISSDMLTKFIDKKGKFKSTLRTDVWGLLSLYEASYLNTGENVLNNANEFSSKCLASCMEHMAPDVRGLVSRTLKNPSHMTISRYNARYYLEDTWNYGTNGALEELARLDFNLVQSLHRKELEEFSSWWKSTGLTEELKFARNQPLKWYLWSMALLPEPQFSKCRIEIAKVIPLIYIIDDIYDIYGKPDELSLFTDAIRKWDLSAVETLPTYMQACYAVLYNITNEIAQTVAKEHSWNPINSLSKSWKILCDAFMLESKWLRSKQIPRANEYLENAMISSGVPIVLMHAFFLWGQGVTEKNVNLLESNPAIMSCPAKILRLWDDLGSAKDENQDGFDGSYVDCYINKYPHYSIENARNHVKQKIFSTWQDLNKECLSKDHFAPNLVTGSLNTSRMVEVMYRYDDNQNLPVLKDYTNVLLFKSL